MKFRAKYKSLLASIAVMALAAGCGIRGGAAAEGEEILTPVAVQQVGYSDISSMIVYAGQITANQTINVSSKIAGRVKDVFFDVGDVVKEGDVLFTLDEIDLRNQIRQLEGQLNIASQGVANAQNALTSVTGGQFHSQVLQMETQVESARLGLQNAEIAVNVAREALDNATTTYNNIRVLFEAGSASRNDYDRAELGLVQARAGLEQATIGRNSATLGLQQATENLELIRGEVTDDNLQRARLGVSQAEASRDAVRIQLEIARETLEDTAIKAPINGVISARNARATEFTSTQMPAFSIVDIDTVAVSVRVSEIIINLLRPGQQVELFVTAVSSEPLTGVITTVSPAADMTSTFPVKIEIPNPGQLMRPGMFAEAHFVRAASSNTVVLPRNAVMQDTQGRFVFTMAGDTVVKTTVETGIDNGREIEVISGLSSGDIVIVRGHDFVTGGDRVIIVE
ncbi:MAG: efflux RND transporter periplasmic adaptor subunit [Defluviitaleaceae bacterium]|nr:efflux RND transporter periplasmic adaptor subunit [Defluviitaleaceae bacterium]